MSELTALGARVLASATDPLAWITCAALAFVTVQLFARPRWWIIAIAISAGAAASLALGQRPVPAVPPTMSSRAPGFVAWDAIKNSKYEEHWAFFVGVGNLEAADWIKLQIDNRERDCAILVGRGPNLLSRCQFQSNVARMLAGGLLMALFTFMGYSLARRRSHE